MSKTGNVFDMALIKRLFAYSKPYKSKLYTAVVLTILMAAMAPLRPVLIQYTIDNVLASTDELFLVKMLGCMLLLLLVQCGIMYFHGFITGFLGQAIVKDLRTQVFKHIVSLRLKYFDNSPIGMLITRTVSDIETIADVFSEGFIIIIGDILQLVVVLSVMFYTSWQLSLVTLSVLPLLFGATYLFQIYTKKTFQTVRNEVSALNTFLQEHISGMSVVQLFARETAEMDKFEAINARHRNAHIKGVFYYAIFFPTVEIVSAMSMGLIVWYGTKSVIGGGIGLGVVTSFILYINMLFRPIRELADKVNTLQMGIVSSERLFKVLDTNEQTPEGGSLETIAVPDVRFENVWFAYNDENYVLKNISFDLTAGQTIALVGATGAGKSSIINLLSRFYEINKGHIFINNIDYTIYKTEALRAEITTVLQDVFLFSDSIFNNITLNNPDISLEKAIEAAKAVGAHDFIMQLPGGYHYNVQERGATLSSGQAQLISFVRAMVYNPKILVLDEATSSVDTDTELLIQNAITTLLKDRTSIVIAHRLSTIQHAHKIIVLDKGEIKEQGSHQELLALEGYYKRLYDLQFAEVV